MLSVLPIAQAGNGATFWFPPQAAEGAAVIDWLYMFILWNCVVFFVIIIGVMAYFTLKYRRRKGVEVEDSPAHDNTLEIVWSVIPLVLVTFMFYYGFRDFMDLRTPPSNPDVEISVIAKQWSWLFRYPNGGTHEELHVPVNRTAKLVMQSEDVLHSLYIPEFRVKFDIVPGRYTHLWFKPTIPTPPGELAYRLFCTEYCGDDHSNMMTRVVVHEPGDFQKWMGGLLNIEFTWQEGERRFAKFGCTTCHTVTGQRLVGPPLDGIWGKKEKLQDGTTITVDENYIRDSILTPGKDVVLDEDGIPYPPTMPTFKGQITEDEIRAIILFIKYKSGALKDGENGVAAPAAPNPEN